MQHKILTGDRPTGPLHLGHYVGSLKQRVELQSCCEQTVLIADMQALTDNAHQPQIVANNILNVMADYLAVGIEPDKTAFCLQSALPALSELTMFYANLVTISRLGRNPTVKAEIASKQFSNDVPAGFFCYPISQAADITAFKADLIPVGDDQLPMLELTNEIVRKLNKMANQPILVECKPLLGKVARLPGIDGRAKMSKTLGNAVTLGADENTISAAVKRMYTDPKHLRISDPGHVEGNVVFTYLDAFHSDQTYVDSLKAHYQQGGLADSKVKAILEDCLQNLLAPIRKRRATYLSDKAQLVQILRDGTEKAYEETQAVLASVKEIFGVSLFNQYS